jgi:hypothetical protein
MGVVSLFERMSRPLPIAQHFTGMILSTLRRGINRTIDGEPAYGLTIGDMQGNGSHGVYQASVRLEGDPTLYRLILAPADAPIQINGHPIDQHFARPL